MAKGKGFAVGRTRVQNLAQLCDPEQFTSPLWLLVFSYVKWG